jgi:hypothetical protein
VYTDGGNLVGKRKSGESGGAQLNLIFRNTDLVELNVLNGQVDEPSDYIARE